MCIDLDWSALPSLPGALECIQAGTLSSLHTQNARAAAAIAEFDQLAAQQPDWPLLVDPQTAGGLLAAVPSQQAGGCAPPGVCGWGELHAPMCNGLLIAHGLH